jgi:hypothetical protein
MNIRSKHEAKFSGVNSILLYRHKNLQLIIKTIIHLKMNQA